MKILLTFSVIGILSIGLGMSQPQATSVEDEAPTVGEIMKVLHKKDKLHEAIVSGNAKAEQKAQLLDLYLYMADKKPENGDADEWSAQLQPIVIAAAKVAVGREGAEEAYKKAVNCKACHDKFKDDW